MSTKKKNKLNTSRSNPYNGVELTNAPITDREAFLEYFNHQTRNDQPKSKKLWCVMQFFDEYELGIPATNPKDTTIWINTRNAYFHNGALALDYYTNTPCEHSQLIDATDIDDLIKQRNQMLLNFQDTDWLNKNIYQD